MKTLITTAFFTLLAGSALAFQCPADMAAIDASLETATLGHEDMARVKELRATGAAEHDAGNHQASVDALAEAKALLNIWVLEDGYPSVTVVREVSDEG